MKKKIIAAVIIIAVLAAIIYFATNRVKSEQEKTGVPRNATPVELAEAKLDTIISKVSVKGVIGLVDSTAVYPEADGRVAEVLVKVNDVVKEGDVILKYSDEPLETYRDQITDLNLQLESARLSLSAITLPAGDLDILSAQLAVNQSQKEIEDLAARIKQADSVLDQLNEKVKEAQDKREEIRPLFDEGIISKADFDVYSNSITTVEDEIKARNSERELLASGTGALEEALDYNKKRYDAVINKTEDANIKSQVSQGQIGIEQIELKIAQLQKQIDEFVYEEYAPVSGTVLQLSAQEGGYVTRQAPIAEIADVSHNNLVISANVPEADVADIAIGQEAVISASVLGRDTVNGKITKILPIAKQQQTSNTLETVIGIELSFTDPSGKLRANNTVDAEITTKISENVVVVPLMATFSEADGREFVYVLNGENSTVTKREVVLISYSGLNVEVTNVAEGEKVVDTPPQQLTDGAYVREIIRLPEGN
ncbi:MAG: HlyD family efflux transporter periplasmic adaptor subunit [Clostridiales bacterium]|jgi:HlyD family secretion protein|nr:HlyD family efflux transporter periplasmic adaptor subunit [Clostridiales bacterium]